MREEQAAKLIATICECNAALGTASGDKLQSLSNYLRMQRITRACPLEQTAKFKQRFASAMQCQDCQQRQAAKIIATICNAMQHRNCQQRLAAKLIATICECNASLGTASGSKLRSSQNDLRMQCSIGTAREDNKQFANATQNSGPPAQGLQSSLRLFADALQH